MSNTKVIFGREFAAYFSTPIAYVFIVIFLALSGSFAFFLGNFFGRGQADLHAFFTYAPWLYLLFAPAVAMRLWAEEKKTGTIELIMTLPVSTTEVVLSKFFAAWAFIGVALMLTFPMWLSVNYLGEPDNGVILAGYIGTFFMAGGFLAIGSCISAMTNNQVIAFIVSAVVCFLFLTSGLPLVLNFFQGWTPDFLIDTISTMSFLTHFSSITKGIIDLRDVVFYGSLISLALFINVIVVDAKKGA
jgi:ABC-2 type transport system permease protein